MRLNVLTVGGIHQELVAVNGDLLLEETSDVYYVDGCIAVLRIDLGDSQRLARTKGQ